MYMYNCLPLNPTRLGHHRTPAKLPVLCGTFLPAVWFTPSSVHTPVLLSQFIPSHLERAAFFSLLSFCLLDMFLKKNKTVFLEI